MKSWSMPASMPSPGQPGKVEILHAQPSRFNCRFVTTARAAPPGVQLGMPTTLGFQLLPMLTEQLKATLTLETAPDQGCCFTLTIPDLIRE
jgi:two-component sensor histidine kinase